MESATRWPGSTSKFEIPGEATDGAFGILEFTLGPHRLIPPHTHIAEDKVAYVLEGDVGFRVGDEIFTATPGTYVQKPRGIAHRSTGARADPEHPQRRIGPGPRRALRSEAHRHASRSDHGLMAIRPRERGQR